MYDHDCEREPPLELVALTVSVYVPLGACIFFPEPEGVDPTVSPLRDAVTLVSVAPAGGETLQL